MLNDSHFDTDLSSIVTIANDVNYGKNMAPTSCSRHRTQ